MSNLKTYFKLTDGTKTWELCTMKDLREDDIFVEFEDTVEFPTDNAYVATSDASEVNGVWGIRCEEFKRAGDGWQLASIPDTPTMA